MINFLAIPVIKKAADVIFGKRRLLTEYFVIACLISVGAATFILWSQKMLTENKLLQTMNELSQVNGRLLELENQNQEQEVRIKALDDIRERNSEALTGLLNDFKTLARYDKSVRQRLETLERTNETINQYLNHPIPWELECVLNNCPKEGDSLFEGAPSD